MAHKGSADLQEWKTVYEDPNRKILASGDRRRAIKTSTGEIITEYSVGQTPSLPKA